MTRDEQGHELVAKLLSRHRRVVLVPCGEEHGEHVIAIIVLGRATLGDLLGDELVDLVAAVEESLERAGTVEAGEVLLERRLVLRRLDQGKRAVAVLEERRKACAKRVHARARIEAEDSAQDDLERQRLKAGVELGDLRLPRVDLVCGDARHQVGEALHALAVEGGEHELSLRHVLSTRREESPSNGRREAEGRERQCRVGGRRAGPCRSP